MNSRDNSQVYFFDNLQDMALSKPYIVLETTKASSLVKKFEDLGTLICVNPQIRAKFKRLNMKLDAPIAWCVAIDIAMKNGAYPSVVLPYKIYERAISALVLVDGENVRQDRWGDGDFVS